MSFKRATKLQAKGRFAWFGPAGSGKSYTALRVGCAMAKAAGGRVAAIDTERGSLSKYADEFDFDVMELANFGPQDYVAAINEAAKAGYAVTIIDSLSHAWMGKGGALEQVDNAAKRDRSSGGGNKFGAWREVTPIHNQMVDAILGAPMHIIVTMRTKMEYVQEKGDNGKTVVRKIGLQPVQRDGLEYEFDVVGDIDGENNLVVTKTRCRELTGKVINKPGEDLAEILMRWLTTGEAPPTVKLATPEQVREIKDLLAIVRLPEGLADKWFAKAGADVWEDMPADVIQKCIDYTKDRLPMAAAGRDASSGSPLPAPESDPFTAALNAPADQFKTFLIAEARKHGHNRADVEAGLAKWLNLGGATIETLTIARREELAEAVVANVIDFKSGQMREAVGAA